LQLNHPLLLGISDGDITATLVGIVSLELPGAIVNLADYGLFSPDPEHPSRVGHNVV
jgi:hypothetical protein